MAGLSGTKTHENLKHAFAGESQANRRYLYFARQADVEGYPDLAGLFRDTAEGETGHAHGHLEFFRDVSGFCPYRTRRRFRRDRRMVRNARTRREITRRTFPERTGHHFVKQWLVVSG